MKDKFEKLLDKFFHSRAAHIVYMLSALAFIAHLFMHLAPLLFGGWFLFEHFSNHTH